MSNKKLVTMYIEEESLDAFYKLLLNEVGDDEISDVERRLRRLYNELYLSYNAKGSHDYPKDLNEAIRLIDVLREKIDRYKDFETDISLRLFSIIESIVGEVKCAEFNIYDEELEIRHKKSFSANNIICITTSDKGREKTIYTREHYDGGPLLYRKYILNDNSLSFSSLCNLLNNPSMPIIKVSNSVVVNVTHFDITKDNLLHLTCENCPYSEIMSIKISDTISKHEKIKRSFIEAKQNSRRFALLQEYAINPLSFLQ